MDQLKRERLLHLVFDGTFGLERETLRVDERGYISQTAHPFPGNSHIDRDFCECQVEIISPVCHSIEELMQSIESIDRETKEGLAKLSPREYLWPFSNPPYISGEDSIPIARYAEAEKHKEVYREYLAKKYGKRKMLFCGIHYNFAYTEEFLHEAMEAFGETNLRRVRDRLYLKLSEKIELYSWMIVFLTASSPVYDGSFFEDGANGEDRFHGESSVRSGEQGYWNTFVPIIDYSDMAHYTESLSRYVQRGQLRSASEWYTPVRIKPRGENSLENLRQNGASHIELRMLDVNPLSHLGVLREDLEFIHVFLVFLTFQSREPFGEREQINAVKDHKQSSRFDAERALVHLHGKRLPLPQAAGQLLDEMESFFRSIGRPDVLPVLEEMKRRCADPTCRHAHRVYELFQKQYVEKGMRLAAHYAQPGAKDLNNEATILNL